MKYPTKEGTDTIMITTYNIERFEVYQELAGDIRSIIEKVKIGIEPLEGKCSKCPKVRIRERV